MGSSPCDSRNQTRSFSVPASTLFSSIHASFPETSSFRISGVPSAEAPVRSAPRRLSLSSRRIALFLSSIIFRLRPAILSKSIWVSIRNCSAVNST